MIDCIYCKGNQLRKNGPLSSGGQRWKCIPCDKQFSTGGARATYSPEFKRLVIDEYCHTPAKARDVLNKYHISSRTLIKRKKDHLESCDTCT